MALLIPVKYHDKMYPARIRPRIEEIAGHFDKTEINPNMNYSLHTEYSVGKRELKSKLLDGLTTIKSSHKNQIPRLWYSKDWAEEFHEFIVRIVGKKDSPSIIEIHPPFTDYCGSIYEFINNYTFFELKLRETYPETEIFIENRCGTIYRGGKFLLTKIEDLIEFSRILDRNKLKLKVVLDIPQLFAAHYINLREIKIEEIKAIMDQIKNIRHNIKGIHLWGKKLSQNNRWSSHIGDLNDYFSGNTEIKKIFLKKLYEIFDDDKKRYFVPEVNSSNSDLWSIVNDLINVGFRFIS